MRKNDERKTLAIALVLMFAGSIIGTILGLLTEYILK